MRKYLLAASAALGLVASTPALAQGAGDDYAFGFSGALPWTLEINGSQNFTSIETGWVRSDGNHQTSNQNYIVGTCCFGSGLEFNNYAGFDLAGLNGPVTSARLLVNSVDVFLSVNRTYTVYDVLASLAALDTGRGSGDAGGIALHLDLQSGPSFGSFLFTPASPDNTVISITLNAAALAAIERAAGGIWVTGGSMNLPNIGPDVPEPATWGMMLLGFGLAGAAMRRRTKVSVTYA